jgi:hypothetical protein
MESFKNIFCILNTFSCIVSNSLNNFFLSKLILIKCYNKSVVFFKQTSSISNIFKINFFILCYKFDILCYRLDWYYLFYAYWIFLQILRFVMMQKYIIEEIMKYVIPHFPLK